jgi:hypothetical protein
MLVLSLFLDQQPIVLSLSLDYLLSWLASARLIYSAKQPPVPPSLVLSLSLDYFLFEIAYSRIIYSAKQPTFISVRKEWVIFLD